MLEINENRIEIPSTSGSFAVIQKKTRLLRCLRQKKLKRRINTETQNDEQQEEAYMLIKQLQNKKPRYRFQLFGELVEEKIQCLRTECAQNIVEDLISNILFEASMGKYDQTAYWNALPGMPYQLPIDSHNTHYYS